jgi:hypothetical protein
MAGYFTRRSMAEPQNMARDMYCFTGEEETV